MESIADNITYLYIILSLIVLALVLYLLLLVLRIRHQKKAGQEGVEYLEQMNQKRHEDRIESIKTICLATVQKQCEPSEGCIRVKKLLEYYPDIEKQEKYNVIFEMYEEIKGFDTLEKRNALSKQEKFKQDNKRFMIEEKYNQQLIDAFDQLAKEIETLAGSHYNFDDFAKTLK